MRIVWTEYFGVGAIPASELITTNDVDLRESEVNTSVVVPTAVQESPLISPILLATAPKSAKSVCPKSCENVVPLPIN